MAESQAKMSAPAAAKGRVDIVFSLFFVESGLTKPYKTAILIFSKGFYILTTGTEYGDL